VISNQLSVNSEKNEVEENEKMNIELALVGQHRTSNVQRRMKIKRLKSKNLKDENGTSNGYGSRKNEKSKGAFAACLQPGPPACSWLFLTLAQMNVATFFNSKFKIKN